MNGNKIPAPETGPASCSRRSAWGRHPIVAAVVGKAAGLALIPFCPVAGIALYFASGAALVAQLVLPAAQGLGPVATRFRTEKKEVWLTIDDGPDAEDTPEILDALREHDARASFFVVGERAARLPEMIRAIIAAGHEVGHHTHTHPSATFWSLTPTLLRAELDRGFAALHAVGVRPRRFRAPVGIKNVFLHAELERAGMRCVAWSVRSRDCHSESAEEVVARVMRSVRPGAIILMHEGPHVPAPVRIKAIRLLLDRLDEAGYRCVIPPDESPV